MYHTHKGIQFPWQSLPGRTEASHVHFGLRSSPSSSFSGLLLPFRSLLCARFVFLSLFMPSFPRSRASELPAVSSLSLGACPPTYSSSFSKFFGFCFPTCSRYSGLLFTPENRYCWRFFFCREIVAFLANIWVEFIEAHSSSFLLCPLFPCDAFPLLLLPVLSFYFLFFFFFTYSCETSFCQFEDEEEMKEK